MDRGAWWAIVHEVTKNWTQLSICTHMPVQFSHSVVSNSLRPHGLQPTRLLCPWDSPGKTTGVSNPSPYLKELAETDTGASYKHHPQHSPRERNTLLAFGIKTNYSLYGITTPITNILLSCSVVSDSLSTPWTAAHQAPLSIGFPRQKYWSRLPFPSLGDLLDPEIEPASPALAGRFFTTEPPGKPNRSITY